MPVCRFCYFLVLNESNSEVKELHASGHRVYGEMRIA